MQDGYSKKEYEKGIRPGPAKNSYRFAAGILVLCAVMFAAEIGVALICIIKGKQISPTTWSVFVIAILGIIYSTRLLQDQKEAEEKAAREEKTE